MKALTIRQPWAWAILCAGKNIENRRWSTSVRGRIAIHAAKAMTIDEYEDATDTILHCARNVVIPRRDDLTRGAIIGTVELVNCVTESDSPWFFGKYGFVLRDPQPLAMPIPIQGAIGFWDWEP